MNLNRFQCVARLTGDPESKTFGSGAKKTAVRLAIGKRYKDKTGEWKESTVFLDGEGWSYMADRLDLEAKGNMVFLEGELKQESWDDKNTGQKRSKIVLVVETCVPLAPRKREQHPETMYGASRTMTGETPF